MKKRRLYIAAAVVLFLGLLVWWSGRRSARRAASTNGLAPSVVKMDQSIPDAEKMQMILKAENGRPIDFFGKVVDQHGQPVAGAKIRGSILSTGLAGTASHDNYVNTDASGLFSFAGLHGAQFWVTPGKNGYAYIAQRTVNWSESYKPDPAHPMVFTMYKLQGAEPMVRTKFEDWVPYDGTPVSIDLFTGKKSDTGEFKLTLTRTPLKVVRGRDHFDWKVKIEVAGGLVEENDSYPYFAPEGGYQPTFEFSIAKDNPHWTQKLVQGFFIRTKDNAYGRIYVDLTTDSDRPEGTGLSVEAYLNPTLGSRNLEFDPAKTVKPGSVSAQ